MKLDEFIDDYVLTDPEWRAAYEAADATREAISRIERGAVSPSLDTLSRIAKGLGMRPLVTLQPIHETAISTKSKRRVNPKGKTPVRTRARSKS